MSFTATLTTREPRHVGTQLAELEHAVGRLAEAVGAAEDGFQSVCRPIQGKAEVPAEKIPPSEELVLLAKTIARHVRDVHSLADRLEALNSRCEL